MSRIWNILKKGFLEPHKIPAFCLKKIRTAILCGRSCFLTLAVLFFKGKTPFPRLINRIPSLKNMALTMVDIGFRGGLCLEWNPFHEKVACIGFELNEEECKKLNSLLKKDSKSKIIQAAIGGEQVNKEEVLYITNLPDSVGLKKKDWDYLSRFNQTDTRNLQVMGQQKIRTVPLDQALDEESTDHTSFLKLDCEGFEKEIVGGAKNLLNSRNLLGIKVEIWNGPILSEKEHFNDEFASIDCRLREKGFHLFKLVPSEHPLKTFNRGYLRRDRVRFQLENSFSSGFLLSFDALYFKDPVWECMNNVKRFEWNDDNVVKMAMIYYTYGFHDFGVELLNTYKDICPDTSLPVSELIESFCPPTFFGKTLPYSVYQKIAGKLHWPLEEGFALSRTWKGK